MDENLTLAIISTTASIFSFVQLSAPGVNLYEISKTKETHKFPYFLLILNSLVCFHLMLYSAIADLMSIFVTSLYGFISNLIFLLFYIYCTDIKNENKILLGSVYSLSYFLLYLAYLAFKVEVGFFGMLALLLAFIRNGSTLQRIITALKLRDHTYIAINLVIVLLCNSFFWTWYSILVGWDMYLFIPNTFGVVINALQILVYKKLSERKDGFLNKFDF